jgi:bifunctional DNA-binding transcriptional regulator/antitoxin component of YhaV-PrlF toxin-antitoxin module
LTFSKKYGKIKKKGKRDFQMRMTEYTRKLDNLGRLVLPQPLREQLNIECGVVYNFFIHEHNDKIYLCIECPGASTEVEKAKRLLLDAGYTFQQ